MKAKIWIWLFVFLIICFIGTKFNDIQYKTNNQKQTIISSEKNSQQNDKASFTVMGVGDNLLHDVIFNDTSGNLKDIDYNDIYDGIRNYTNKDLNYINFETICAGEKDGLSLSGYPMFNGPSGFNDAISKAGFNWMSLCSNHTYDMGTEGVLQELNYLKKHDKSMVVTGAYATKKDSQKLTVVKINGIRVGLASYTYGFNSVPDDDKTAWMVNQISEKKIKEDMKKLNKVSDVQIVTMHWGIEYQTKENADQRKYAKLLNKLGVEVIIGTHPHILEPVKWIHSKKQDTLCYYSLGNFVSAQDDHENMIGGMAEFKVTYDFDKKKAKVTDAKLVPTVTYYDSSYNHFNVYPIQDWTDKKAKSHYVTVVEDQDITKEYVIKFVKEVMKDSKGVEIVTE